MEAANHPASVPAAPPPLPPLLLFT